jgi:hypothetical protein
MGKNFTTLDVGEFQKKMEVKNEGKSAFDINTVFLTLIVVTLIILAVLLFILIQKKMQELALACVFA